MPSQIYPRKQVRGGNNQKVEQAKKWGRKVVKKSKHSWMACHAVKHGNHCCEGVSHPSIATMSHPYSMPSS